MRLRHAWLVFVMTGMLGLSGCQEDHRTESQPTLSAQQQKMVVVTSDAEAMPPEMVLRTPQEGEYLAYMPPKRDPQEMILVSMPIAVAPTIDGKADESYWENASAITTLDFSSQRPITLRSVYTADEVFFLVTFPDEDASETHKTWVWDTKEEIYREGPDREDVFIFKWSMSGNNISLALRDYQPHRADIWFWKARRTNPAGYADDKWQELSTVPLGSDAESKQLSSPENGTFHFRRWGDQGEAAYEERFFYEYKGNLIAKYYPRTPQGSRGDVRAKGVWHNGQWSIEFARKLDTGDHEDDVAFVADHTYLFTVACYAIAFDTPHEMWSQPLYRTGDAFDRLLLIFAPKDHS